MTSDFASILSSKMEQKWPQNGRKKVRKFDFGPPGRPKRPPRTPKATHGTPRALKTKPKAPPKPKNGPQNSPRTRQKVHKQPQTRRTTNEKNKKTHTHKPAHKHKPNKSTTEQPKWRGSAECAKRLNKYKMIKTETLEKTTHAHKQLKRDGTQTQQRINQYDTAKRT